MIRIQDILDKVTQYQSSEDAELVRKSYVYAAAAHAGQMRLSGEPYFSHPLAVADTLADMRLDGATVAAGLLHDTVEDTKATIEELDDYFGEEVADIVDGVTKISLLTFDSKEAQQAENIRKMILAMNEDMRVLFVKLADRLHNMRTLEFQKVEKQRRIAQETMDIYAPLANRLGLHRLKLELEDLSFRYLAPDSFAHIASWLEKNRADDTRYIEEVIGTLRGILSANGIEASLKGRIKNSYGIYRKMHSLNVTLDEMHDIIAFRAIVKDLKDCYAALGLVHATWKPVPGRFKDYISMPKANMYQSLHTTVIGPRGERMEVQIRSGEMDNLAENGLASHWLYKEGERVKSKDVRELTWLREMLDWQKMETDSREFLRSLRFDLFKDEIYVFTPNGAVKELPENATPVDFAYHIHTEVGNHCAGGKVNGKLVPLATPLKSGDTVEIITDPHRHPSRDWLKFVKTAKARTRIQNYIRTEEHARSITLGREMLEKQGRRHGVNVQKALKDGSLLTIARELNFKTVEALISAVGYARITPRKVLNLLAPKPEHEEAAQQQAQQAEQKSSPEALRKDGVRIKGVDDLLVRFGKCCNPVPGDPIVGYISRGRGLVVHNANCAGIQSMEAERLMSVYWEGGGESAPFLARIRMICINERGALSKISGELEHEGVNIDSGQFRSTVDGRSELEMLIEVTDIAHLYRALDRLRRVPSVREVERLTSAEGGTT
jgi:(p)ppGpp synthetase, RelA/SpoT family